MWHDIILLKLFCAHLLQISVPTFVNFSKTGKYGFHCGHSCKVERLGVRLKIYKQRNNFSPFFLFMQIIIYMLVTSDLSYFIRLRKKYLKDLKWKTKKKFQQKISHPLIDNFLEQIDPAFIKRIIFFVSLKLLKYLMWMTFIKNKTIESISLNQRIRSWLNLWERTCR